MDHASLPDHVAGDYRAGRVGYLGLVDMPKQEFPEFTIRQGVVVGVYPGATSGEVEEQLAKPLERYLFTFKEVKKKRRTPCQGMEWCT